MAVAAAVAIMVSRHQTLVMVAATPTLARSRLAVDPRQHMEEASRPLVPRPHSRGTLQLTMAAVVAAAAAGEVGTEFLLPTATSSSRSSSRLGVSRSRPNRASRASVQPLLQRLLRHLSRQHRRRPLMLTRVAAMRGRAMAAVGECLCTLSPLLCQLAHMACRRVVCTPLQRQRRMAAMAQLLQGTLARHTGSPRRRRQRTAQRPRPMALAEEVPAPPQPPTGGERRLQTVDGRMAAGCLLLLPLGPVGAAAAATFLPLGGGGMAVAARHQAAGGLAQTARSHSRSPMPWH